MQNMPFNLPNMPSPPAAPAVPSPRKRAAAEAYRNLLSNYTNTAVTSLVANDPNIVNYFAPPNATAAQTEEKLRGIFARAISSALETNTSDVTNALNKPYDGICPRNGLTPEQVALEQGPATQQRNAIGTALAQANDSLRDMPRERFVDAVVNEIVADADLFNAYKEKYGQNGTALTDAQAKEKLKRDVENNQAFNNVLSDLKNQQDLMLRKCYEYKILMANLALQASLNILAQLSGSTATKMFVGTHPQIEEGEHRVTVGNYIGTTDVIITKNKDGSLSAKLVDPYNTTNVMKLLDIAIADGGTDDGSTVDIELGNMSTNPNNSNRLRKVALQLLTEATGMGAYKGEANLAAIEAGMRRTPPVFDKKVLEAYEENLRKWGGKSLNLKIKDCALTTVEQQQLENLKTLHKLAGEMYALKLNNEMQARPAVQDRWNYRPELEAPRPRPIAAA